MPVGGPLSRQSSAKVQRYVTDRRPAAIAGSYYQLLLSSQMVAKTGDPPPPLPHRVCAPRDPRQTMHAVRQCAAAPDPNAPRDTHTGLPRAFRGTKGLGGRRSLHRTPCDALFAVRPAVQRGRGAQTSATADVVGVRVHGTAGACA